MIVRKGTARLHSNMSWRDFKCWLGTHLEWRRDVYVNDATPFLYCPNCHQERVPDFYTPMDIPPPSQQQDKENI